MLDATKICIYTRQSSVKLDPCDDYRIVRRRSGDRSTKKGKCRGRGAELRTAQILYGGSWAVIICYDMIDDAIGGLPCCPYLQTYDESAPLRENKVDSSDKCTLITNHVDYSYRVSLDQAD